MNEQNENKVIVLKNVKLEANRNHIDGAGKVNNTEGKRNFTILFEMSDEKDAAKVNELLAAGWPVTVEPRYKNGDPEDLVGRIKVVINYNYKTPPVFVKINRDPVLDENGVQMTKNGAPMWTNIKKTYLDEETSKEISRCEIEDVTVLINMGTYLNQFTKNWTTSVYLKEFWFVQVESPIAYMAEYMDSLAPEFDSADSVPFDLNE